MIKLHILGYGGVRDGMVWECEISFPQNITKLYNSCRSYSIFLAGSGMPLQDGSLISRK